MRPIIGVGTLASMNPLRGPLDKARGAYYTEERVARSLCAWAIRDAADDALDPAFGGGVFIAAASERLSELKAAGHRSGLSRTSGRVCSGRVGSGRVYGVEIDRAVHSDAVARFGGSARPDRLLASDFFALSSAKLPGFGAIVGNPPYIRFQRFAGERRKLALARAREVGMELSPLAGSWVAFTAHATSFLRPGGRMALVLPAELGHAASARPLLDLLQRRFGMTTFVRFRNSLFPHLDQETILLLADEFGSSGGRFRALELSGPEALERPLPCRGDIPIDAAALVGGRTSLALEMLPGGAREIYLGLRHEGGLKLSRLATVTSGYVTGANEHFHVSTDRAAADGLPDEVLVPALFRARALRGLMFDEDDWERAAAEGSAGFLVQPAGYEEEAAVRDFLLRLEGAGVPRRYKARTRKPWYRVNRVSAPPLLLTAMAGSRLSLVVNSAGVALPNTFHAVVPVEAPPSVALPPELLAAAWLTSLTALSTELEGHTLGGGMLKLDPGRAGIVLLASPVELAADDVGSLDRLLREGEPEAANHLADRLLLGRNSGLSPLEVDRLAQAARDLRERRRPNRAATAPA